LHIHILKERYKNKKMSRWPFGNFFTKKIDYLERASKNIVLFLYGPNR